MDDLDAEMKISFIDEARQLLEAAEQCFLDLESKKGDPEVIETLFRLAHNMKGTSRAVGFGEVAEFTHELENLLLKLKEKTLSIDDETVNLLLECNDHLKEMVDGLSLDLDARFDSRQLIEKITIKLSGGSIEGASAQSEPSEETDTPSAEEFESHSAQFRPSIEMIDDDPALFASETPLSENRPVVSSAAASVPSSHEASAGSPSGHDNGGGKKSSTPQTQPEETIRVSLARLEKLSDFIGELVIMQTVLNQHRAEFGSQLLQRTVSQLGKLSKEIQDISMSLRMIPIKQTFAKLQRIVRDTSKALGKTVDLTLEGDQTEVDKTVLEHISDPLVHIVRNAIDHGLEMPDERESAGKKRAGKILIRAFHQGSSLVIEVRDDGKGLDAKKLIKKSIEKGVISANQSLTDAEAMNLIFLPGFSTKDQVSEISGRGVGLDVVRTNVERLGGTIQLESALGSGSCFRISLPLTLAIVDGMVIDMAGERFVIPLANVHETVQPRREDIHFVTGRGEMLTLRDQVLPLFRLSQILKMDIPKEKMKASDQSIAIVCSSRKDPFAVLVDDIIRQQQIVIKKLGAEIRDQRGFSGSAILGDGRPALILDLNELVEKTLVSSVGRSAPVNKAA